MRDQSELTEPRPVMMDVEFATLLAVVRYHSFSEAADRLCITQSTVSYRIRALERRIGQALLDRGRGRQGVELTSAGEALLNLAERWESIHSEIQQFARRVGTLGVGATDSVNTNLLAPVYRYMVSNFPDVQLRVISANSRELYALLDRREIDVAFVLYARPSPGYRIDEFRRESMVVVTAADLGSNGPIDPEELNPQDQIQVGWPDPLSGLRERRGAARISVDTAHLIRPFLADAAKWALVPTSMVPDLVMQGRLQAYDLRDESHSRITFKVVRTRLPWAVRQAYELLDRCLAEAPRSSPVLDAGRPRAAVADRKSKAATAVDRRTDSDDPRRGKSVTDPTALRSRLRERADAFLALRQALLAGAPWPLAADFGTGPEASWGPPEVLAHVAEMLPYWLGEAERILEAPEGAVPFGRTATDAVRLAIIERDRTVPPRDLFGRVEADVARYFRRLDELTVSDLARVGLHPARGRVAVGDMLELIVVDHLAEHTAQLRALLPVT